MHILLYLLQKKEYFFLLIVVTTFLILDGNSEIGALLRKQFLLFDLFEVFDQIESSHKSDKSDLSPKNTLFLHACKKCSELPSFIISMVVPLFPKYFLYKCTHIFFCYLDSEEDRTKLTSPKKMNLEDKGIFFCFLSILFFLIFFKQYALFRKEIKKLGFNPSKYWLFIFLRQFFLLS